MDERFYRFLMIVAITLTVSWVGWSIYDGVIREGSPGDSSYLAGNTFFEDTRYAEALREYQEALQTNPDHIHAKRGKARSLMQLGRNEEALRVFDELIGQAPDLPLAMQTEEFSRIAWDVTGTRFRIMRRP